LYQVEYFKNKKPKRKSIPKRKSLSSKKNPSSQDAKGELDESVEKEIGEDRTGEHSVFLVQEKPEYLTLFKFHSKSLISPSASASEYAYRLGQATDDDSVTHIYTDRDKLRSYLESMGVPVRLGSTEPQENPRNSLIRDALFREAIKYKKFLDFSKAFWESCSRGIVWYPTDEKKFYIGKPERKLVSEGKFFVFCSPELALQEPNEESEYVAELDLSLLNRGSLRMMRGSGGSGVSVLKSPEDIKVLRILDAKKARRAYRWQLSILPSSQSELELLWEKAHAKKKAEQEKLAAEREKKRERDEAREEAQRIRAEERKERKEKRRKATIRKEKLRKAKLAKSKKKPRAKKKSSSK